MVFSSYEGTTLREKIAGYKRVKNERVMQMSPNSTITIKNIVAPTEAVKRNDGRLWACGYTHVVEMVMCHATHGRRTSELTSKCFTDNTLLVAPIDRRTMESGDGNSAIAWWWLKRSPTVSSRRTLVNYGQ